MELPIFTKATSHVSMDETKRVKYNNIPFSANTDFCGREEILSTVDKFLGCLDPVLIPRSLSLLGMGGVGKTQIAMQYAYRKLESFDVILWISAESPISIEQSFRKIANDLGLPQSNEKWDATYAVKKWLSTTNSTFLLVFDNADNFHTIKNASLKTVHGTILVTTRDLPASTFATVCVSVSSLPDEDGSACLLKALDLDDSSPDDQQQAIAITQSFGGLPLAIAQIAGFIKQRKMPLSEFLALYKCHLSKLDANMTHGNDHERKMSFMWNVPFEKLSSKATCLLNLLSFFNPDEISEEILIQGSRDMENEFSFLFDGTTMSDAFQELLRAALIHQQGASQSLSIHRLVQSAAQAKLSKIDAAKCFDAVVHILCLGFPNHSATDISHQIATWPQCENYLPHVYHLIQLVKYQGIVPGNQQQYADLLLRCSWYSYEREMYIVARDMVKHSILAFEGTTCLEDASAIDLGGLIELDLVHPVKALESFKRALEMRKVILDPEDPFIAYSMNNIALAYTEMGELDLAFAAHQEAIRLRAKANSNRIGNSYMNMSSLLLRMGRPDEAEGILANCPSLKDFTDETFLGTGNPRFSGDMVLLSRIRLAKGRPADALKLATKALDFRQKLHGNRLKTCDSQYDVGCMLLNESNVTSAIQMLQTVIGISETLVEGDGQRARALYKLSEVYANRGMLTESAACKQQAVDLRAALRPDLKDAPFIEAEFCKLCSWMLW